MSAPEPGDEVVASLVNALTPMLVRRFRHGIYATLQPSSPVPVRDGTYPLLAALRGGPASASQVSESAGVDRSVVVKQATALEKAGLIRRSRDSSLPRVHLFELTNEGRRLATDMRETLHRLVDALTSNGISLNDLEATTRTLLSLEASVARRGAEPFV